MLFTEAIEGMLMASMKKSSESPSQKNPQQDEIIEWTKMQGYREFNLLLINDLLHPF